MEEDALENQDLDLADASALPESGTNTIFKCPNCGVIQQDDVIFLCNVCNQKDLILKDGIYMCPDCLKPGENFECMICGSTEVTLVE